MKKKGNGFLIILIALFALCFAFFVGIPMIAKYSGFYDMKDKDHTGDKTVTDDLRVISSEIPEDVLNRGIILRGIYTDSDPRTYIAYRYSLNGEYCWIDDYTCDCNLIVDSSDEEFKDFCDSFSGFDDPYYAELNGNAYYTCFFRVFYQPVGVAEKRAFDTQLFRSGLYTGDVAGGKVMVDAYTGIEGEVFYDPTGKYILILDPGYMGDMMDDFMLAFLEPGMVKLEVSSPYGSTYSTEDPEEIRLVVDNMHQLELSKVEEEMPELAMAENQTTFTFTDVNGYVNDYVFIGEYLVSKDIIYHVENRNVLDDLMKATEAEGALPSRVFFENLDRESGLEEIVDQIGQYGIEGSGILYYVWSVDDGSKAKMVFNSTGKIEFIYIVTDDSSEIIYDRDNS